MFQLKQQFGMSFATNEQVKLAQWQLLFDGVLVGYVQQRDKSQIEALFNFPHDALTDDALLDLHAQAFEQLGREIEIARPEEYSRKFVEEALAIKAQEESEDDDE